MANRPCPQGKVPYCAHWGGNLAPPLGEPSPARRLVTETAIPEPSPSKIKDFCHLSQRERQGACAEGTATSAVPYNVILSERSKSESPSKLEISRGRIYPARVRNSQGFRTIRFCSNLRLLTGCIYAAPTVKIATTPAPFGGTLSSRRGLFEAGGGILPALIRHGFALPPSPGGERLFSHPPLLFKSRLFPSQVCVSCSSQGPEKVVRTQNQPPWSQGGWFYQVRRLARSARAGNLART